MSTPLNQTDAPERHQRAVWTPEQGEKGIFPRKSFFNINQFFGHFGPFFSIERPGRVIGRCASSRRILKKKCRPQRMEIKGVNIAKTVQQDFVSP